MRSYLDLTVAMNSMTQKELDCKLWVVLLCVQQMIADNKNWEPILALCQRVCFEETGVQLSRRQTWEAFWKPEGKNKSHLAWQASP
jgi:hypothetical protein